LAIGMRERNIAKAVSFVGEKGRDMVGLSAASLGESEGEGRIRDFREESLVHTMDDILSQLPSKSIRSLLNIIKKLRENGGINAMEAEDGDWHRVNNVILMEALMSFHEIARTSLIKHLDDLSQLETYFRRRMSNPVADFVSNGAEYLIEADLNLKDVGFQKWIASLLFTRRSKLRTQLKRLKCIRQRVLQDIGVIHCRLGELSALDTFTADRSLFWQCHDAMYKQLEGSEPNVAVKEPLYALFNLFTESLGEYESRVTDYLELSGLRPSHFSRHMPKYLIGATAGLALLQTSSGSKWFNTACEIGGWLLCDCFVIPTTWNTLSHNWYLNGRGRKSNIYAETKLEESKLMLSGLKEHIGTSNSMDGKYGIIGGDIAVISENQIDSNGVLRGLILQVQQQRVDIDSTLLQLTRLIEANRLAFALLLAIPASVVTIGGTFLLRHLLGTSRAAAARRLRTHVRKIEELVMHSPVKVKYFILLRES